MVKIRYYNSIDYNEVVKLYKNKSLYGGYFDSDRDSEERMFKSRKSILVAEDNGEIVGTISFLQDKRFAVLFRFAVVKSNEDKVRFLLLEEATKMLRSKGHNQFIIYGPTKSVQLHKSYKKLKLISGDIYKCFWKKI